MDELYNWHKPNHFLEVINRLRPSDSADYFNAPGNQIFRDAWIAGEFAIRGTSEEVRLVNDNWPDFQVSQAGTVRAFESIEADLPGRRRGDEYKDWKKRNYQPEPDEVDNWRARRDAIPIALENCVRKKTAKNYDVKARRKVGLVINLNLGTYGEWRGDIETQIFEKTRPAAAVFQDVWVLWDNRLYRTWPEPLILGNKEELPPDPELEQWLFDEAFRA